ncbi:DUF982 domain-containing protein [Mesorhizobium sp. M0904]|uniref:DUF982 domain-containing protein n=1 Tax=unclassified Mesorhizobium TaxID=325217 RepID=UPI00333DA26D
MGFSHDEGAAEQLQWTKLGPKWKQAVETCMAAMAGDMPSQDARRAFEAAARRRGRCYPRSSLGDAP